MPSATTDFIVISIADIEEYFSLPRRIEFFELADEIRNSRALDGKPPIESVVSLSLKKECPCGD